MDVNKIIIATINEYIMYVFKVIIVALNEVIMDAKNIRNIGPYMRYIIL